MKPHPVESSGTAGWENGRKFFRNFWQSRILSFFPSSGEEVNLVPLTEELRGDVIELGGKRDFRRFLVSTPILLWKNWEKSELSSPRPEENFTNRRGDEMRVSYAL